MDLSFVSLIVGLVSALLIQGAKKIQAIPLNSGQTAKLRITLTVLSLGGNALNAYLNGDFENFAQSEQINLLLNSLVSGLFAHFTYKWGIK